MSPATGLRDTPDFFNEDIMGLIQDSVSFSKPNISGLSRSELEELAFNNIPINKDGFDWYLHYNFQNDSYFLQPYQPPTGYNRSLVALAEGLIDLAEYKSLHAIEDRRKRLRRELGLE